MSFRIPRGLRLVWNDGHTPPLPLLARFLRSEDGVQVWEVVGAPFWLLASEDVHLEVDVLPARTRLELPGQ